MTQMKYLGLCALLLLFACNKDRIHPSGNLLSQTYPMQGFTQIEAYDGFQVHLVFDTLYQVEIKADDNLLPYLLIEANNASLQLSLDSHIQIKGIAQLHAYIHMPASALQALYGRESSSFELQNNWNRNGQTLKIDLAAASKMEILQGFQAQNAQILLTGASQFEWSGPALLSQQLDCQLSAASKIQGQVQSPRVQAQLSGASEGNFNGHVQQFFSELSGASQLRSYALHVDSLLQLNLSGASHAELYCAGLIELNASGASELHYQGPAQFGLLDLSGGSNYRKTD